LVFSNPPALAGGGSVKGKINPRAGENNTPFAIGFELRLPTRWSGRFFFQGGGGNDGAFPPAMGDPRFGGRPVLSRGFATVKTDGGHLGTTADTFGFDPQARVDHAYNAYGKTAGVAKAIIDQYHGKKPDKSYFAGCSGGGRQGMMFTQRFPEYFDGVVAAAPAMSVATKASISVAWESQAYNSIAPTDASGNRILSQAFSNTDLTLVSNAILQTCDSLDGLVDGSINNTAKCKFDPVVLQCAGEKNATCLSAQQVTALKKGFGGPYNSAGQPLYITWPWDAGIKDSGWRGWKLGTSTTATPDARFFVLMQDAIRNEFFTPPEPTFSILNFNFNTDPARMATFGVIYDTWKNVELSAYRARGGKLVIVHGVSDPIFSANESIDYYNRLVAADRGSVQAGSFARLFLVPGMTHCGGGPATDLFDILSTTINWVENGNVPERIIARGSSFPGRTRPLCPYPSYARYTGQGSIEDANNFVCESEK
jgi:pimeloyl-ACP methyl ester carboxylesterase